MRCFVPNCENTIGVPFPEDEELKNIWLKSLNVEDVLPEDGSFVCLDHFDKDDIEDVENEGDFLERRVSPNAVPKVFLTEDAVEENVSFQTGNESLESSQNDSESSNFYIPINEESSTQSGDVNAIQAQSSVDQDLEISQQSVDLNSESENLVVNAEQNEILSSSEIQEDVNTEEGDKELMDSTEEPAIDLEQVVPEIVQSPPTDVADVDMDKQNQLADFQNYEAGSLQGDFLDSTLTKEENVVEDESQEADNEFSTDGSQFQPQVTDPKEQDYVADEDQESVQIFASEDQPVITSEDQHMFIAEGQNIITSAGQHVYVTEGQTLSTSEGQQNSEEGQQPMALDQSADEQIDDSQEQVVQNVTSKLEAVKKHIKQERESEAHSKDDYINSRNLVINEQSMPDDSVAQHQENLQPAATLVVKKEVDTESPRNIVMEWFVPQATNDAPQTITNFSGILGQTGTQHHGKITSLHRTQAGVQQRVQQRVPFKRSMEAHTGAGTSRKPAEPNVISEETCRLCGSVETKYVNILDNIKNNIMILEAIQSCIHPLEVSLEDPFSKKICVSCFNSLQKYYEFRQKCLEMNIAQRRQYEKAHPGHKSFDKPKPLHQYVADCHPRKSHVKTIISPTKAGYKQTEVLTVTKSSKGYGAKNITRKIILTPTNYNNDGTKGRKEPDENVRKVISRSNKSDNLQVFKTDSRQKGAALPILGSKNISASQIEASARKPPLSPEKQSKIQEELKKVIEGKMSKDELSVDQVIVRVVSDDESDDFKDYVPIKRRKVSMVNSSTIRTGQGHSKMRIGKSEVVIPKGIRVTIPDRFESSKGVYPCFKKFGAFNTEFALIDGYLFEHRLCKGKERFLKCLSANCPSKAQQKLISNEAFENRATVSLAHNHHPLTSTEIKKQMFYYIMKKKMQADRGMNFRNIYDQICQKDPEIAVLVPLRSLINEICKHQLTQKVPPVNSFEDFYNIIEDDALQKFQFTFSGKQFYQERFTVEEEGTKAVVFANVDTIKRVSNSKLMYVDASFKIDTQENFNYQLVTVLVWIDDSYYPIMFALVSNRTMEIFKKIFGYLHDTLAPNLCPDEIVTDYEANIYYALGETYLDSHIGGSVFYYTQNLYKKICELGLSKELETTSYFRNIYHMLLMLPLLPVNTIMDGLQNIEIQANDLGIGSTTAGLFEHIKEQWIEKVTPDLFCVHRLENRINENVIAPFKKLRDFSMLNKGKTQRQSLSLISVVEKLIELENFSQTTYSSENKKSFGRDLSSSQKKNVLKAWHYIESHPKININHFFTKVIGYIKCMENQLWIWGYYKFSGKVTDDLINAANFSIVNNESEVAAAEEQQAVLAVEPNVSFVEGSDNNTLVMEAVVGPSGEFLLSNQDTNQEPEGSLFKYVYKSET